MPIQNVLFDMDGTLVDSYPGIESAIRFAVENALPGHSHLDWRPLMGPPIREIFRVTFPGISVATLDELEKAFRFHYDREGWKNTVVYEGVAETLVQLSARRIKCFVATNKPFRPAVRILRHLGLRPYFLKVISRDSKKPPFASKTEMVTHMLSRYRLNPLETLFVGDGREDAVAAQSCRLKFAAVGYGYEAIFTEFPNLYILHSMSDLLMEFRNSSEMNKPGISPAFGVRGSLYGKGGEYEA